MTDIELPDTLIKKINAVLSISPNKITFFEDLKGILMEWMELSEEYNNVREILDTYGSF